MSIPPSAATISFLLLFARLVLGLTFAVAGITKLADRVGTRQSLRDFGLANPLVASVGLLLPATELIVATALLPRSTALYGAAGSLVLLAVFLVAIGINLARGRRPDCHCFGQVASTPVGAQIIVRNGILIAISVFVLAVGRQDPGPSAVSWVGALSTGERALSAIGTVIAALLGFQTILLWRLVSSRTAGARAVARAGAGIESSAALAVAPEAADEAAGADPAPTATAAAAPVASSRPGLPRTAGHLPGSPAPEFALPDLDDRVTTVGGLLGEGKPLVLVFTDPNCGPCEALLPEIATWQRQDADRFTLALVSRGTADANRSKVAAHGITRVLLQRDREAIDSYNVVGTPSAVLVHVDGRFGSTLAQGEAAIRNLMADASRLSPAAPPPPPAPDFALPDLDGREVTLEQFRGEGVLLLFWNPTCSYCQQLLSSVRAFDARPTAERPRLVVISSGTADAGREMGLASPVLIDPAFATADLFGVSGTPSAILIDAEGRQAELTAVGGAAVLKLANQPLLPPNGEPANMVMTAAGRIPAPLEVLPPGAKPRRQECVEDELLSDGSMVLYNGCRQTVLTLNPTAALVWEYCDGEHDVDAIAVEMLDIFPAAASAPAEVRGLVDDLLQAGMIAAPVSPADLSPLTAAGV